MNYDDEDISQEVAGPGVGGLSRLPTTRTERPNMSPLSFAEPGAETPEGALTTASPQAKLSWAQMRMNQLTEHKKQVAEQAKAREAAMHEYARMIEQGPRDMGAPDPGLLALGRGILSAKPGQGSLGVSEGLLGMEDARRKLAEREWARKTSAQKVRAEEEEAKMVDINNLAKLEKEKLASPGDLGWRIDTVRGVWTRMNPDTGQEEHMPIGGADREKMKIARQTLDGVNKEAEDNKQYFLDQAKGDPVKAGELSNKWRDDEYTKRLGAIGLGEFAKLTTEPPYAAPAPAGAAPSAPAIATPIGAPSAAPSSPIAGPGRVKEVEATGTAMGKDVGETPGKVREAAASSRNLSNQINTINSLLEGSETGKLTPLGMEVAGWGKAVGNLFGVDIDVGDLPNKEAAQAVLKQLTLALAKPSGGAALPGALSNADREFLEQASGTHSMTTEGRKKLFEIYKKIARRGEEVESLMDNYMDRHNGTFDRGFYKELRTYSEENPLFGSKPKSKTDTSKYTQTATNPQTGQKLGKTKEGKWEPIQ